MANRPVDQPDWEGTEQLTPDAAKRLDGFETSERPIAGHFNWFFKLVSQWIAHLAFWTANHDHKATPGAVGSSPKISLVKEVDWRVDGGAPLSLNYGKMEVVTNTPTQHVLRYSGENGNDSTRFHAMGDLYAGQVGGGGYAVFSNPRIVLTHNENSPSTDRVEVRLESGTIQISKKAGASTYSHINLDNNIEVFSNNIDFEGAHTTVNTTNFTVSSSNSTFTSQAAFNSRINAKSHIMHNDVTRTMAYDVSGGGAGTTSLSRMEFRTLSAGNYYDSTYLDARAYRPSKLAPTLAGEPYHGEALYQGNLTKIHGFLDFTKSTNANQRPTATGHGYNVSTVTRALYTGVNIGITSSADGWRVNLTRPVKCDTITCSILLKEHTSTGVVPWEAMMVPRIFNKTYNGSGELIWFMISATVLDWDNNGTTPVLYNNFKNLPNIAYDNPNPIQIHFVGI